MSRVARWLAPFGTVILLCLITPIASATDDNFTRCRDGMDDCKRELLSMRERSIVAVFDRGRNLSACVAKSRECNRSWLTPKQFELIEDIWQQEKDEDRRVRQLALEAEILENGRNFSACAHGREECNPRKLSESQRTTIGRLIAEEKELARLRNAEAIEAKSEGSSGENALIAIFGAWRAALDGLERSLLGKPRTSSAPYAASIGCSQTKDCPVGFKCVRKTGERRGVCKRR